MKYLYPVEACAPAPTMINNPDVDARYEQYFAQLTAEYDERARTIAAGRVDVPMISSCEPVKNVIYAELATCGAECDAKVLKKHLPFKFWLEKVQEEKRAANIETQRADSAQSPIDPCASVENVINTELAARKRRAQAKQQYPDHFDKKAPFPAVALSGRVMPAREAVRLADV